MRVLIVPFPWKTHVFNLVPLAWSLQTAGHEVRVAGWPDLLDAVTGAGLLGVGVGPGESGREREAGDRRQQRERGAAPPVPGGGAAGAGASIRSSTYGPGASGWAGSRSRGSSRTWCCRRPAGRTTP